jgi:CHAD domain-containing protein/uncharacterized protein Yka (UPF0111/DUF47 family)
MKDVMIEKWIEGVVPTEPTGAVAERSLQNRLDAVLHYLPLAAEKADEDAEHVHQLRVWTRRATAALRLYEELLPRRRFSWMKKQLRRIRRAANEARDCDVLLERLGKKGAGQGAGHWRKSVQAERNAAQEAVSSVHDRLKRDDRFARRIDKLLDRVQSRTQEDRTEAATPFGEWAHHRLRAVVEPFLSAIPADHTDAAALHQFRIRGKELRYAMELLAGAFPETLRTDLYPVIEAIQDRLGEVNDLATATARLQRKVEEADGAEAARWRRVLGEEEKRLQRAIDEFWEWCTPQMLQELRDGFADLLGDSPVNGAAQDGPPTLAADPPSAPSDPDAAPKARIIGELGEGELLLPALVNEGLTANDRAKYLMTLLQSAREHADHPDQTTTDLRQERLASGVADADLDAVIGRSRREGADVYHIPAAGRIHERLVEDVRRMLAPLGPGKASGASPGDRNGSIASYDSRLRSLLAEAPPLADDRISGAYIRRLTSGQREAGDSLHLLVMDLHKELNRLQQQLATESIDGAQVYGIRHDDRPLVAAFMAGVNQTRELKFDHPGLGTTATRSGDRLVLQNDIGMTDAHVLVVHVQGQTVTLTYTDVHIDRLVFFQDLFARFGVHWQDTVSRRPAGMSEEMYHLCLGTYTARDPADLLAYLTFLGSRLVFLIDWNRARKRLRRFARRRVCLEVLRRAADHNYGHMGFLTLGGEQLILDALQSAGRLALPPGGLLSDFLGPEKAADFLSFTLQTASEGRRGGRSEFLIRDEISAELRHYIDTAHQRLLDVAAEHASLVVELATAARDLLIDGTAPDSDRVQRTVQRARHWEHRADELVNRCRAARGQGDDQRRILELLTAADDIADGLEEAVFRASLLRNSGTNASASELKELADLAVEGAQEYLKAVENARRLHRASPREQVDDFLQAIDRTMTVEHETDDAHRRAQGWIVGFDGDYRQWHLLTGVADKLEEAADAAMRSALVLRNFILGEVLRR